MRIATVNILSNEVLQSADAICFTSNGIIKANGRLVMGAGNAKAFRDYFLNLDRSAAHEVNTNGNKCQIVRSHEKTHNGKVVRIIAFPTKHHWKNPSDLELIKKSAIELVALADELEWKSVYLPPPGCGHGGLDFDTEVKPMLEKIFDSRFVITFLPKTKREL